MTIRAGDKLLFESAEQAGMPLKFGETYTVRTFDRNPMNALLRTGRICEDINQDLINEPAVTLMEVSGVFMFSRFKVVSAYDQDEIHD